MLMDNESSKSESSPKFLQATVVNRRGPAPKTPTSSVSTAYTDISDFVGKAEKTTEQLNRAAVTLEVQKQPSIWLRLLVLVLTNAMMSSTWAAYMSVPALQAEMTDRFSISAAQFGLLLSAYSLPNCVAVFFSGILADRYGLYRYNAIYCGMVLLGNLLVSYAGTDFSMLLLGRLLYGVGAESMSVTQSSIQVHWFSKDPVVSVSVATGLTVSLARFASMAVVLVLPSLSKYSLDFALNCLVGNSLWSLLLALILWYIDRVFFPATVTSKDESEKTGIQWQDVRQIPAAFYVICVVLMAFSTAAFSFTSFASKYFEEHLGLAPELASQLVSFMLLVSGVATPVCAPLLSRGLTAMTINLSGMLLMTFGVVCTSSSRFSPFFGPFLLGVGSSVVMPTLWPAIPCTVSPKMVSSAFGLIGSAMNVSIFASNLTMGFLIKSGEGSYTPMLVYLLIIATIGVASSAVLVILNPMAADSGHTVESSTTRSSRSGSPVQLVDLDPAVPVPTSPSPLLRAHMSSSRIKHDMLPH